MQAKFMTKKKRVKLEFYGHWLRLLLTFFIRENVYSEPQSVRPKASYLATPAAALRAGDLSYGVWGKAPKAQQFQAV